MPHYLNRSSTIIATILALPLSFAASQATAQESRRQKPEDPQRQSQYRDQADSMQQDLEQKDNRSFAGTLSQKHGKFYLDQEFHKGPLELTNAWDVKRFLGKKVRVTGIMIDPEKNIVRVIAIAVLPTPKPHATEQTACPAPPCH